MPQSGATQRIVPARFSADAGRWRTPVETAVLFPAMLCQEDETGAKTERKTLLQYRIRPIYFVNVTAMVQARRTRRLGAPKTPDYAIV
jgi:hypothetical protein